MTTEVYIPKLLIIGDPHASPKYDNSRFDLLAHYIEEEQPTHIVNIGDMADMSSQSSYDRGKRAFEGRRYTDDCNAVHDALQRINDGVERLNGRNKRAKRGLYTPKKYLTLGNHEHRINRLTNDYPELTGKMHVDDLRYREFGWEVTPYRGTLVLGGVTLSHDFPTGISGRSIGGESMAKALCQKNLASSVCGHSHIWDHHERTSISGRKIFGLSVGCYTHPEMIEDWNINTYHMWDRCLVLMEGVTEGYYQKIEKITMSELEKKYG